MPQDYLSTDISRLKRGCCGGIVLTIILFVCPPLAIICILGAYIFGIFLGAEANRDKQRFGKR